MKARVRLPLDGLREGERTLSSGDARYLNRVRRVSEGELFMAFDPGTGMEAEGTLVTRDGVVRLSAPRQAAPDLPITWIHGLAKGDKCDAIVRDATELGVTEIVFAQTARSVVDLAADRASRRLLRWEKIAQEAARQSERCRAPRVRIATLTEAFAGRSDALRICLYEEAIAPLAELLLPGAPAYAFFTGPEGGLDADEVADAENAGFKVASLGARILRTETVPAAVLGALQFLVTGPLGT